MIDLGQERGDGCPRRQSEKSREMKVIKPARQLGLVMCTALVVGNMIGSGVFLLPAALGAYGGVSLVGWLLTSVGAMALALTFAE